jgi:hypothetical protein
LGAAPLVVSAPSTTSTTAVPSGGGSDDAAPVTTTIVRREVSSSTIPSSTIPSSTIPQPATVEPAAVLEKVQSVNRMVNPVLGSQIPLVAPQAVFTPSSNKVVGNNVVLKVNAPAQSTVHVYRDGILVKSVPAAASQAIKIDKNKVGKSSFQILIVNKKGVITTTKKSTVRVQKASK